MHGSGKFGMDQQSPHVITLHRCAQEAHACVQPDGPLARIALEYKKHNLLGMAQLTDQGFRMHTTSPQPAQSLMLRIRFKGIAPSARTALFASPTQEDTGLPVLRRLCTPAIAGSHARIRFIGIDQDRQPGASGMALARHACTLQGLLAANKPARPFFGPAYSGVHRSTDWLRQKTAR